MIELQGLTKRYGDKTAVDHLTFTVRPGVVTGFLGPNGAGKSTTMRMLLGLDSPTSGDVRIDGKHYAQLSEPLKHIGALLDAKAIHGGRTAYNHLLCIAQSNRIPTHRVDEVLETVGLTAVARKRSKGFSLGMGQRLGIAGGAARRPGDPDVRRAGQRARPRGHPLDPQPDEGAGRAGPYGLRLQPPDERDGADRRAPDRDRPRPAAGRHLDGGLHREELPLLRAAAHPAAGAAQGRADRGRAHRGDRPATAPSRSPARTRPNSANWPRSTSWCCTN